MKHHKHLLRYVDLNPQPIDTKEPSPWLIWFGAAFALAAVYVIILLSVLF